MPLLDGGIGNSDGEGDIGVGIVVVGIVVLVGDADTVAGIVDKGITRIGASLIAVMGSTSTTHFSEEKSGLGTKREFPVFGTLDFHFSSSGPFDPAAECEVC